MEARSGETESDDGVMAAATALNEALVEEPKARRKWTSPMDGSQALEAIELES
jgi:hypothetical protein